MESITLIKSAQKRIKLYYLQNSFIPKSSKKKKNTEICTK